MCRALSVGKMWYYVLLNISGGEINLCEAPSVSVSRLGGDGRTCQQVAEHWEWDQEGCAHFLNFIFFCKKKKKIMMPSWRSPFVSSDRRTTTPPRRQSATCCRWCTRTPSAGRTHFRRIPVWAGWEHSCRLLLLACSAQREHLSRCMSAQSTATGERVRTAKLISSQGNSSFGSLKKKIHHHGVKCFLYQNDFTQNEVCSCRVTPDICTLYFIHHVEQMHSPFEIE